MANFDIMERYDVRFPGYKIGDVIVAALNETAAIDFAMMPASAREHAKIVYHSAL
jgi:hypothetical protein